LTVEVDTIPLAEWPDSVRKTEAGTWEQLPDLDLYMDQVVRLMDKYLAVEQEVDGEKLLTSGMINNYVKGGTLPRPRQKKYGRVHLALLQLICRLKAILPLSAVTRLTAAALTDGRIGEVYTAAMHTHVAEMKAAMARVGGMADRQRMGDLAVTLALEANARRLVALYLLNEMDKEISE